MNRSVRACVGLCATAELKLGRFPTSCLPHPAPKQHFGEMPENPLCLPGPTWWLSQLAPGCWWPLLFLLHCAWGWEKSDLMEIFLRKAVDLIFSLTFTQLESWWRFRQHLLKRWGCVMCSTAIAPARRGPSSHSEGFRSGWWISDPHPTGVCLPASLSLLQICLVWAGGETGRRSRAAGS